MPIDKNKDLSIASNKKSANKLVLLNPSISLILRDLLILTPFIFVTFYTTLNDINSLKNILTYSKLICNRSTDDISCSFTGKSIYGNVEKVFSSKKEKLIKARQDKSGKEYLLVLITTNQEFFLYTQESMVESQLNQLNDFLKNINEPKLHLETVKSSESDSPSLGFIICWYIFNIYIYVGCINSILGIKKYIFDKENNRLTIRSVFKQEELVQIQIKDIKKIAVKKDIENRVETVFLNDDNDSILISINLSFRDSTSGSKLADSICSFLQLEPYETIEVPP